MIVEYIQVQVRVGSQYWFQRLKCINSKYHFYFSLAEGQIRPQSDDHSSHACFQHQEWNGEDI